MADNSYTAKVNCLNCEWKGEVEIPKGTPINKQACSKCGCKELEREIE